MLRLVARSQGCIVRARALAGLRRPGLFAAALGALALLGSAGCLEDFDPPSKLDSLRILAIRAEPPEARPGETVTLDALTFAPADASPPPEGASVPGEAVAWSWRACFLASGQINVAALGGGGGGGGGPFGGGGAEAQQNSCFDFPQALTLDELLAAVSAGGDDAPDLSQVALDLGDQPTAQVPMMPLPSFPGIPSFCFDLSDEERAEQGGREFWISGMRMVVSLRLRTAEETIITNKRLVSRPAVESITEAQQGMPFRTPRLCQDPASAERLCARNENPAPPVVITPNGEWDGVPPLRIKQGDKVRLLPALPEDGDRQDYIALSSCGDQLDRPDLRASGGEFERKEARFYAWFSEGGNVGRARSILGDQEGNRDSSWATTDETVPGTYSLWVVTRDGRGGVAWTQLAIEVEP